MWLITNRLQGADRAKLQIDAIKYGLGAIAAGGAVAALLLSVRRQLLAERSHQLELQKQSLELRKQTHTENDAAERRVTELFTKAVEQLGSLDAAVRLGSLYALERVAQNNVDQRQTIVEVICAYLRMPYTPPTDAQAGKRTPAASEAEPTGGTPPAEGRDPRQELQVRLTAQRILTTHLRRPAWLTPKATIEMSADPAQRFWPAIDLDLTGAALVDWDLSEGIVRSSDFRKAAFSGAAFFLGATFVGGTSFAGATFSANTRFEKATFLRNTSFAGATFSADTWFAKTAFSGDTSFAGATFSGNTWFDTATFSSDTRFAWATFSGTTSFGEATFSGNTWFDAATFSGNASFESVRIPRRSNRRDTWPTGWAVASRDEFNTLVRQPARPQGKSPGSA